MKTLEVIAEEIQEEETDFCQAKKDLVDDPEVILLGFNPFYKDFYGEDFRGFYMYLSKDEREFYTEFDEPDAPWDELLSRNDVAVYQCVKKVKGKYLLKKIWQRDDLKKEELKELSKLHNERWLSEKYIKEFMKMTSNQEQKLIQDMYKKIRGWNK